MESKIRLKYLTESDLEFRRRPNSVHLDVKVAGEDWVLDVTVTRAFPLSHPTEFLSVRDKENKEIGLIPALKDLPAESRKLVSDELDRRYFTPQITRIVMMKKDSGMLKFDVETTRGRSDFFVRNWRDSAYELVPGRWQIVSVDGGRYEILNLAELDQKSIAFLEELI